MDVSLWYTAHLAAMIEYLVDRRGFSKYDAVQHITTTMCIMI